MLLGDFNARFGHDGNVWKRVLEKFAAGLTNSMKSFLHQLIINKYILEAQTWPQKLPDALEVETLSFYLHH